MTTETSSVIDQLSDQQKQMLKQQQELQQAKSQQQPEQQQDTSKNIADPGSPWGDYLNSLNAKYQDKIKRWAQLSNFNLTIRNEQGKDEKVIFTKMKMLQWQFDELEDLRSQAAEEGTAGTARKSQKTLSTMYKKASGYLLWNAKKEKPMTEEEYNNCVFAEVRPALDAAMLLSLVSDPN